MSVSFSGSRGDLALLLTGLGRLLAGKTPDPAGLVRGVQLRLGNALLSRISQAFLVKSRGGMGDDGFQWPPLKPATIAQRRLGPADRKHVTMTARIKSLSPAAQAVVRKDYRRRVAELKLRGMPESVAKSKALTLALNAARRGGGNVPTKIQLLGGRQVDMLRDTGRLFASLAAGVEDRPSNAPEQVIDVQPGLVVVGTNVKYATFLQHGTRKMPARKIWPDQLPPAWWDFILRQYAEGIKALVGLLVQGKMP